MARHSVQIIVPVYNEERVIDLFFKEVASSLSLISKNYRTEIIFVDDGSSDSTRKKVLELKAKKISVRLVSHPANAGHQAAIATGILHATADCIIMMDGDLQHPPILIEDFLARWEDGFDVVKGVRLSTVKGKFWKEFFSRLFYRIFNLGSRFKLTPGECDFRLLDRSIYEGIKRVLEKSPNRDLMLRALIKSFNFKSTNFEFIAPERAAGESRFIPSKMLKLAMSGLFSYSRFPILVLSGIALLYLLLLSAYAAYVLWIFLFTSKAIPGQTSILILIILTGFLQFIFTLISLGYSYRIYQEQILPPRFTQSFDRTYRE